MATAGPTTPPILAGRGGASGPRRAPSPAPAFSRSPADLGCSSPAALTEAPVCLDGLDNDGDGLTDYPADPGCTDRYDASERDLSLPCDDGVDNDGDGF